MGYSSVPRLWRPTTVPTFPVALDRSHPLARGLALSIVPGSRRGAVDFVNDLAPVVTGAGYVAPGARGPGYVTNTTGVLGYAQAVAPPVFSMEVLVQAGGPGTRNEFICGWDSAAAGGGGLNDRSITGFGGGATGSFEGYIFSGSPASVVGGTSFFAGLISHVAMTSDGTTLALYVNGVSVASTAAGSGYAGYSNPSYFVVGSNDRTSWWWSGTIQLANLATVAWTAGEVAARYAEPFAMFRPIVRRQYFVGVAGGGGAFTGSLSDTTTTSDGFSSTMAATGSLADTTATSDARSGVMSAAGSFTGTASTSDAWSGVGAFTGSFAGTASTSDTWSAVGAFVGSLSDSTATSDQFSVIVSGAYSGSWSDTAATSDAFTAAMAASGALSDSAATSTTFSAAMAATGSFTGTASTSDSFVFIPAGAYTEGWADTVATTDMWAATLGGGGPVAPGTGISVAALTALLSSLPTTLPATPGILWMNGRILCVSL